MFQRWVLTPEQSALLAPRQQSREAYAQVDDADGEWVPPEGLRDAMTAWDFARADHVLAEVQELGSSVRQVQAAAEASDQEVPAVVRSSYEEAAQDEEYAALATTLPRAAGAIEAVGAATLARVGGPGSGGLDRRCRAGRRRSCSRRAGPPRRTDDWRRPRPPPSR